MFSRSSRKTSSLNLEMSWIWNPSSRILQKERAKSRIPKLSTNTICIRFWFIEELQMQATTMPSSNQLLKMPGTSSTIAKYTQLKETTPSDRELAETLARLNSSVKICLRSRQANLSRDCVKTLQTPTCWSTSGRLNERPSWLTSLLWMSKCPWNYKCTSKQRSCSKCKSSRTTTTGTTLVRYCFCLLKLWSMQSGTDLSCLKDLKMSDSLGSSDSNMTRSSTWPSKSTR